MAAPTSYLEQLGEKHQPTKRHHNYLRRYSVFFDDLRLDVKKVVEIGVESGASLRMWEEFFPNATIHGIDIDETCRAQVQGRVTVTIADSTSPDDMARFTEDVGGDIDVVIDDGSHWYEDQIRSFKNLFPHVKYGGFYAIEDMGQADSPHNYRAQRAFEELVDGINYYPRFGNRLSWTHIHDFPDTDNYWIRNVVGISFYRYLAIVEKGHNPEDNPYAEEISGTTETTLAKRKFALDLDHRQRFGKLLRLIADSRKRHFISKREVRPSGYIRAARQKLFGV